MRKLILVALLTCFAGTADAASIFGSFVRQGPPGSPVISTIEDANAEYIVKGAGNTDLTRFEVGDSVEFFLDFERYAVSSDGFFVNTPLTDPSAGGANYQLWGRGSLTITSIGPLNADDEGDISFEGSVAVYEDVGADLNFTSIAAAEAQIAAAAPPIFTLGIGKGDDFIVASDAPVFFADIPASGTAIDADFGLSLLSNNSGVIFVEDVNEGNIDGSATGSFHTFIGSVQTFSLLNATNAPGGADDKFDLRTNTEITFQAEVPEPGSLAIFSVLGAGGFIARRRRAAKK